MLYNISLRDGSSILEPSAGVGLLADGILRKNPNVHVECVELNKACCEELKKKGYNLVGSDFLRFEPTKLYDYVIAAPTFKDSVDVEHIMKMCDSLYSLYYNFSIEEVNNLSMQYEFFKKDFKNMIKKLGNSYNLAVLYFIARSLFECKSAILTMGLR